MRRPRRGIRLIVPGVLACLLAAGCAHPIRGTAVANQADVERYQQQQRSAAAAEAERRADAAELTSQEGLGDVPSLDLCSLVPGAGFGNGLRRSGDPRPSFGYCSMTLSGRGSTVVLAVGPVEDGRSTPFPHRPYDKSAPVKLAVRTDEPSPDDCAMYLQFPDGPRVKVDTNTLQPGAKLAKGQKGLLCRTSIAGIDQVIATVTRGKAKHWDLPADSFGTAGTCTALSGGLIDQQLGRGMAKRKLDYPGGQECQWGVFGGAPRAVFRVDTGPPSPRKGKGIKVTKINGRPTVQQATTIGERQYCYLETAGAEFPEAGKGARELASLYVVLAKDKRAKPCVKAKALATAAWRALPD